MENYKLTQYEVILEKLGALENLDREITKQTRGGKNNIQELVEFSTYSVVECGVSGAIDWTKSDKGFEYWMGIERKLNEILDN